MKSPINKIIRFVLFTRSLELDAFDLHGFLAACLLAFDCLDFIYRSSFSQSMKLTPIQMDRMVRKVFDDLKAQNLIEFKNPEDKVFKRAIELVQNEFKKEADLDREVHAMLDDLERKNPGEFERYKMFPMLKKRLAKDKKVIL